MKNIWVVIPSIFSVLIAKAGDAVYFKLMPTSLTTIDNQAKDSLLTLEKQGLIEYIESGEEVTMVVDRAVVENNEQIFRTMCERGIVQTRDSLFGPHTDGGTVKQ